MMRSCAGIRARELSSEINWFRARKKNQSNFLWSKIVGQRIGCLERWQAERPPLQFDGRNARSVQSVRARGLGKGGAQIRFGLVAAHPAVYSLFDKCRGGFSRHVRIGRRMRSWLRV